MMYHSDGFEYEDRNVDSSLLVLTVFMVNKKNLLLITFVVLSESSLIFFFCPDGGAISGPAFLSWVDL